ncbi:MAG: DUF1702 family protein [Rhodocyclaceae bacterium]|nr:DUF1702 family protein [Rhodocyclaceae bacterium]MBX3669589.1 DUF1702 family protein [Rhodocyclaceae bacterium]
MGCLVRSVLGISPVEASPVRRGFHTGAAAGQLEEVGRAFVAGYNAALAEPDLPALQSRLERMAPGLQGFAYEGAAMAFALLDLFTPWRAERWRKLHAGPGAPHSYMLHVGAGWALARLPVGIDKYLARFDPLLRWLVLDGYGFHEGYFHAPDSIAAQRLPARLRDYARHAFDQGLGRSLWFVCGAEPARLTAAIRAFAVARQGDLWSGVGLAATYAGGADAEALRALARAAGEHSGELAQGACFAAKARLRAGNPVPHNELACRLLAGLGLHDAAGLTDICLAGLQDADAATPAYEIWRRRIRERVAQHAGTPRPTGPLLVEGVSA